MKDLILVFLVLGVLLVVLLKVVVKIEEEG